jgi:hypothetical protein
MKFVKKIVFVHNVVKNSAISTKKENNLDKMSKVPAIREEKKHRLDFSYQIGYDEKECLQYIMECCWEKENCNSVICETGE